MVKCLFCSLPYESERPDGTQPDLEGIVFEIKLTNEQSSQPSTIDDHNNIDRHYQRPAPWLVANPGSDSADWFVYAGDTVYCCLTCTIKALANQKPFRRIGITVRFDARRIRKPNVRKPNVRKPSGQR